MLIYLKTDLFESPAQVLVNTVNTVGVMGKGIALDFKRIYPKMFRQYQELCENGQFSVGQLWLYKTDNKWILNFPTKKNWRNKSKLEYIEAGLQKFVATYEEKKIKSISFPQLGVGNGGLNWENEVRPLMEKYLKKLPINVYVHLYGKPVGEPEFKNLTTMKKWLESEPALLSVNEFKTELLQSVQDVSDATHELVVRDEQPTDELDESSVAFLEIKPSGKEPYVLSQMDVTDFWTRLRSQGVVSLVEFPQILHERNDAVFFQQLMAKLPYIKIIPVKWQNQTVTALALNESNLPMREKPVTLSDSQIVGWG